MGYKLKFHKAYNKGLDQIYLYSISFGKKTYLQTKNIIKNALYKIEQDPTSIMIYKRNKQGNEIRLYKIIEHRRNFGIFLYFNEEQKRENKEIFILKIFDFRQDVDRQFKKIPYFESFTNKFLADIDRMNQQIIEDFRNNF